MGRLYRAVARGGDVGQGESGWAAELPGEPLAVGDPRRVGPYEVLRRLGGGAMGRVYLGRLVAAGTATSPGSGERPSAVGFPASARADSPGSGERLAGSRDAAIRFPALDAPSPTPHAYAAVKVLHPGMSEAPASRRRFARELDSARRVHAPRIAAVLGGDSTADLPWIATEFVDGPSLQTAVEERGPLRSPQLRRLAAGVAEALSAIHAAGVVHRDLKPSNVMLAADGPKVIDFGIARADDASQLTNVGETPGTPAYMSPEQAGGGEIGPPADVFALGLLLAFAATGRPAYGLGDPQAVIYRILNREPDLSGVAEDDRELRALIESCLARDPASRPTPDRIAEVCRDAETTHLSNYRPVGTDTGPKTDTAAPRRTKSKALGIAAAIVAVLGIGTVVILNSSAGKSNTTALGGTNGGAAGVGSSPNSAGIPSSGLQVPSSGATTGTAAPPASGSRNPSQVASNPGGGTQPQSTSAQDTNQQSPIGSMVPITSMPTAQQPSNTTATSAPPPTSSPAVVHDLYSGPNNCSGGSNGSSSTTYYNDPAKNSNWATVAISPTWPCTGTLKWTNLANRPDPTQWYDSFGWGFLVSNTSVSCSVRIYIPNDPHASALAHYWLTANTNYQNEPYTSKITAFTIPQGNYHGQWYDAGHWTFPTGSVDVQLDDNGSGTGDIVASAVHVTC